ncbi:hypothetical protein K431DRAFT_289405 [Polychaeton citri CBS 116435]|uniref:Cytochrome b561 domain-containing protein n=1 Tax=Polychaeton citri CBS 116435 TaxID=1314669 RepID=A0A9P4PWY4_9PEZI|nr:hypothetical protein K431DRAFT_289405 [Polychaeton citri CBS 116435]
MLRPHEEYTPATHAAIGPSPVVRYRFSTLDPTNMSTNGLSPPGSSTYDSSTMFVGDGTWDSDRNSFLLPNLVGLNFDTMRYNGMGNRFKDMPEYHQLILGHGICAFLVFGALVPAAIFWAKYGHSNRQFALKMHVNLQILTLILLTVVFILGFIAVGPPRALTNPHHGIGVAIYVCVFIQFLYGAWAHKREKKRKELPMKEPKKFWIHKLFGRAIALLGYVQIALGLTLYGSPKYLFILYALVGALLLLLYLILDYRHKPGRMTGPGRMSEYYSDYGSYVSGDQTEITQSRPSRRDDDQGEHHWLRNIGIGAGAFAAYEGWKHRRERKRADRLAERDRVQSQADSEFMSQSQGPSGAPTSVRPPRTPEHRRQRSRSRVSGSRVSASRLSPQTWEDDEKSEYTQRPARQGEQHTWRNRILGAGAGIAAVQGVRSLFNRRGRQERDDHIQNDRYYRPNNRAEMSQTDISRVEQGQAPYSPDHDYRRADTPGASTMTPNRPPPGTSTAFTPGQESVAGRRTDYDASTTTPTRIPSRVRPRPSADSIAYDSQLSYDESPERPDRSSGNTLRDLIALLGPIKGFQEWNSRRKERRDRQRSDRLRQHELDENRYQQRTNNRYTTRADKRRHPSGTETVMTGTEQPGAPYDLAGSNPELSRTNFSSRPDINQPPLPSTAGQIPMSPSPQPNNTLSASRQTLQQQGYSIPPPPIGPPPGNDGLPGPPPGPPPPPEFGSAQMPHGAVQPDPSRLYSHENVAMQQPNAQNTAGGMAEGAAIAAAAGRATGGASSQSPYRYRTSRESSRTRLADQQTSIVSGGRRPSLLSGGSGTASHAQTQGQESTGPVSVKMKMHADGNHVTLRRLNDEEAAAERQARRAERRQRRRRTSSLSSGRESDGGPPRSSSSRFRRNNQSNQGGVRPSASQPYTHVHPPQAAAQLPSELNLPPQGQARPAAQSNTTLTPHDFSPSQAPIGAGSPQANPVVGSGLSHSYGSPGDAGTNTDLSAFAADNRKRRRAERARRMQQGQKVEFE